MARKSVIRLKDSLGNVSFEVRPADETAPDDSEGTNESYSENSLIVHSGSLYKCFDTTPGNSRWADITSTSTPISTQQQAISTSLTTFTPAFPYPKYLRLSVENESGAAYVTVGLNVRNINDLNLYGKRILITGTQSWVVTSGDVETISAVTDSGTARLTVQYLSSPDPSSIPITPWDSGEIYPGYMFFLPCLDTTSSSVVTDWSGKEAHATVDASLGGATAFATSGELATTTGTNTGVSIANGKWTWQPNQSLIFSLWHNIAAPGATQNIIGNRSGASSGFQLKGVPNGNMQWVVYTSDATQVIVLTDDLAWDAWVHTAVVYDAVLKTAWMYHNGISQRSPSGPTDWSNISTKVMDYSTRPFSIGRDGNQGVTYAAKFKDIHAMTFDGGLPSNTINLIQLMRLRRGIPIKTGDIVK